MDLTWFYILLPLISLLYAAVGHGGASGYLALMSLFSFAKEELRSTALLLNLVVAGVSFIQFYRAGHFKLRLFLVFTIASVPAAYLGGTIEINTAVYKLILAAFLLLSVLKMTGLLDRLGPKQDYDAESKKSKYALGLFIGAIIGFVSGLIGIGGGIILSPVILLLRWGTAKEAAAVSALFIWMNSLAGLIGMFSADKLLLNANWHLMLLLVFAGGVVGGLIGSKKLNNTKLRYLLSFVLLIAAIKLIFGV
jgi:uncharacterized membrane protein YfcA